MSQEVTRARRDDSDDTVRFPGLAGGSRPDDSVDTLLLPRTGPPAAAALHKAPPGGPAPDDSDDTVRLTGPGPGLGLRRDDSDEIYILSVLLSHSADGPGTSAQGPYIFF